MKDSGSKSILVQAEISIYSQKTHKQLNKAAGTFTRFC